MKTLSSLRRLWLAACIAIGCAATPALAQETVCASVKIRLKQELTLERQAFDAEMKINNTTDNGTIENVSVVVKITELDGTPVTVTDDPNAAGAKFFIRVFNKQNILAVDGTGSVSPATSAIIDWLIIPAPGSAGSSPLGKKYLVGATLRYRFGGENQTLEVSPDVITVKPLPLLTLDYFLPSEVEGDDPITPEIEPVVPFTMGLRIKNNGQAPTRNMKVDSAQPKIIDNRQGLLVNFRITGSYIDDAPAQNTFLLNFGDIPATGSRVGRWVMESTLSGRFTEFAATFSHADELGGAVTSLLQATNAHLLIRDVRVDLPGRDFVRDFLSKDGDVIRVYESEGMDTIVIDRSAVAQLQAGTNGNGSPTYRLTIPPTDGFVYVKLPDPFNGTKPLGNVVRSDAKQMLADNVWLSRSRNAQSKQWEYFINFFDVNTSGIYDSEFTSPAPAARAPVIQFIPDKVVKVDNQVSFIVEASSPDGKTVTLSASPLPLGATFSQQAVDPALPGLRRAAFSWTPGTTTVGDHLITYTATDGTLSANRSANIKVDPNTPTGAGPGMPSIDSPLSGATVVTLRPTLGVRASTAPKDPTTKIEFEIYSDAAMTQKLANALVSKSTASGSGTGTVTLVPPTTWQVPVDLADNAMHWWRARAFDGYQYSLWTEARLFVNQFNDPPDMFNLTSPAAGAEVASLRPVLTWINATDKDGDTVTYSIAIYRDEALTQTVTSVVNRPPNPSGSTSWTPTVSLTNHGKYYWNVTATDPFGARTTALARSFNVYTSNAAPTRPTILSPLAGAQITQYAIPLIIGNSTDANGDLITYVFELDTTSAFNTSAKRSSGQLLQGAGSTTVWNVDNLVENRRYYWRAKSQDGRAESAWIVGNFLVNAVNEPPPVPTISNPGNRAWVASQQPSLQLRAVTDPDGDVVRYQFEVYDDAGLSRRVSEGSSDTTAWIPPSPLVDKNTYYWRGRAIDPFSATSDWSPSAIMYVSTGQYQSPTIQVTAPAVSTAPTTVTTADGVRKKVTLRWEGQDPNIEATVALYRASNRTSFAGTLIVDNLKQEAGTQVGEYEWDVTALPVGTYYVYGMIYDPKGKGYAFAPGAVVIAPPPVPGRIVQVNATTVRSVTEDGGKATLQIKLSKAPTSNVTVPLSSTKLTEGTVSPQALTFTPTNWNTYQTATVAGVDDCTVDPNNTFQIIVGKAVSLDPTFIDAEGVPFNFTNRDNTESKGTTDNPNIYLCGLTIASEAQIDSRTWEYKLRGDLTNTGPNASGISAKLTGVPSTYTIIEPVLQFGAVNQSETSRTTDTVTIRTRAKVAASTFKAGSGYRWAITVTP